MSKKILLTLFVIITSQLYAQHEVFLRVPNSIPLYAQQTNVWCGAGSAQMMLEGYPGGVNHVYQQRYIWDRIQQYKQENWYCDPVGLKQVMRNLGGGNAWDICYYRNQGAPLMHYIAKGMTNRRFPTAVLVYGHQHWVVIVGLATNINPNNSNTIMLNQIEVHDPWQAQHSLISGSAWYSKYWYEAGNNPGSVWHMCYVGVNEIGGMYSAELNQVEGVAIAETLATQGNIIDEDKAIQYALTYVSQITQDEYKVLQQYAFLTPRLVNKDQGAYYLIPIGNIHKQNAVGGIIINAYTGEQEAITVFGQPLEYKDTTKLQSLQYNSFEYIFKPSQQCPSPFAPALKFSQSATESTMMGYDGVEFSEFIEMTPGS